MFFFVTRVCDVLQRVAILLQNTVHSDADSTLV